MKYIFICLFLFFVPYGASAAISINEIAWMGTETSANDEWIELYNDGSSGVDVQGWVLTGGAGLEIDLAGSVAAGQYAVLERTDDASAPGTAFLIYAGSLSNSGAMLSLYRADGSLEDRVSGGEDWEYVGGDNTTKETAQYTNAGWITAVATPGAVNTDSVDDEGQDNQDDQDESEEEDTAAESTTGASQISLYYEQRSLRTELSGPKRVYEMQRNTFYVEASGLASGIINGLEHRWNFGDLSTATGKNVEHRFEYPGEYVVTVHSFYKDYESYERMQVVVLPVSFSLTKNRNGDIQINNDTRYEIDISGYMLTGSKTVLFPEHTILLPNGTITVPKKKVTDDGRKDVVFYDQVSNKLASLDVPDIVQDTTVANPSNKTYPAQVSIDTQEIVGETVFNFISDKKSLSIPVQEESQRVSENDQVAAAEQAAEDVPRNMLPYLLLIGVIGLGVLGIVASKMT